MCQIMSYIDLFCLEWGLAWKQRGQADQKARQGQRQSQAGDKGVGKADNSPRATPSQMKSETRETRQRCPPKTRSYY